MENLTKDFQLIDGILGKQKFIVDDGDHPTLVDVAFYCEMMNAISIMKIDVAKWGNLELWVKRIGEVPEIKEM